MGSSKRKATAPPAPVHQRDGVVERIEIVQTMRKDGKAELNKHPKHVTTYQAASRAAQDTIRSGIEKY